jgi:hypothetical protein
MRADVTHTEAGSAAPGPGITGTADRDAVSARRRGDRRDTTPQAGASARIRGDASRLSIIVTIATIAAIEDIARRKPNVTAGIDDTCGSRGLPSLSPAASFANA